MNSLGTEDGSITEVVFTFD